MPAGNEARKAGQKRVPRAQLEAQAATLGKIVVDSSLQAHARVHDWLPGHGSAIADSLGVSSLA